MTQFGEISPEECMPVMPDGFIETDEEGLRYFYVPNEINVYKRFGEAVDDVFILRPNGAAVAEGAVVEPSSTLGSRVVVYPNTKVLDHATIEDGVILEDRVMIYSEARVCKNAVVGRKTLVKNHAVIGSGANVGPRCTIGFRTFIEPNLRVYSRQYFGDNLRINSKTNQQMHAR